MRPPNWAWEVETSPKCLARHWSERVVFGSRRNASQPVPLVATVKLTLGYQSSSRSAWTGFGGQTASRQGAYQRGPKNQHYKVSRAIAETFALQLRSSRVPLDRDTSYWVGATEAAHILGVRTRFGSEKMRAAPADAGSPAMAEAEITVLRLHAVEPPV